MTGHKGLDDLFLAGGHPRLRHVSFPPSEIGKRRLPYQVDEPGPVDKGVTLNEARQLTNSAVRDMVSHRRRYAGQALLVKTAAGAGKSTALLTIT